jgi:hypothetical protein
MSAMHPFIHVELLVRSGFARIEPSAKRLWRYVTEAGAPPVMLDTMMTQISAMPASRNPDHNANLRIPKP